MEIKKYIFIETFLVALFIFSFGILMGIFIENARTAQIDKSFASLEVGMLDAQLVSNLIKNADCQTAVKENINFADRVYWEARVLEKYEESNEITEALKQVHMKYDILRASIWENSINIKERCNAAYHDVVYLYEYENPSVSKRVEQNAVSNALIGLKDREGDNILLISIAADIDVASVQILMNRYNVTELPTVIIDEKFSLAGLDKIKNVADYV